MKVKLINKFHNTEITTNVEKYLEGFAENGEFHNMLCYDAQEMGGPSRAKLARLERALCGSTECRCAGMIREEVV